MTTLASHHALEESGGTPTRRLWPVVLLIAAVVLAIAPLYLEVLVMHARLAAAEQSMDRIVGRMSVHASR